MGWTSSYSGIVLGMGSAPLLRQFCDSGLGALLRSSVGHRGPFSGGSMFPRDFLRAAGYGPLLSLTGSELRALIFKVV